MPQLERYGQLWALDYPATMTLKEAAEQLGVTPDTLRQQIASKRLKAQKLGRDWFVTAKDVEKYRREHLRGAG